MAAGGENQQSYLGTWRLNAALNSLARNEFEFNCKDTEDGKE